jgi:hypothetical protein
LLAASCSNGGSAGSAGSAADCSDFVACGGDIVGTWNITGECFTVVDDPSDPGCGHQVPIAGTGEGSIRFQSDGTYSLSTLFTVSTTLDVPSSCVHGQTCAAYAYSLTNRLGPTGGAMCTPSSGGCSCQAKETARDGAGAHYTLSGTSITLDGVPLSYCELGNALQIYIPMSFGSRTLAAVKQ